MNWTLFDGFRIRTNYKRLQELQQMGALRTRITIEDFVATLTAEYYNYVQQTLRLSNFRYAVQLSRERLRITEERFKIGSFSRLDLLQARVDFNADSSKYMSQHELVTASRIRINELLANDDPQRQAFDLRFADRGEQHTRNGIVWRLKRALRTLRCCWPGTTTRWPNWT